MHMLLNCPIVVPWSNLNFSCDFVCVCVFCFEDCDRPTDDLNSNIVITPDQDSYSIWYAFAISCPDGYTLSGPDICYCYDGSPDDYWSPDPSLAECTGQWLFVYYISTSQWRIQGGGGAQQPPPPKFRSTTFFNIQFCIRMLQNKPRKHKSRESI